MVDESSFAQLFKRVQQGDAGAINELVTEYESDVRLAVRTMLTDPRLRAQFDSVDVAQSVLLRFCLKAVEGAFELNSPAQLVALLKKIAFRRFLNRVDHAKAQERDIRRVEGRDDRLVEVYQRQAGPATIADWRDEYREICRRLTDDEQALAKRWAMDESWVEIAGSQRSDQDRMRHQLDAAFTRVANQLSQLRGDTIAAAFLKAIYQWGVEQEFAEKETNA